MSNFSPTHIQEMLQALSSRPEIAALLADWPRLTASVVDEALAIQAVPAPTFDEKRRRELVRERFSTLDLADVAVDEIGNVWARTPGSQSHLPALMVSAHLDTVFSADTDLAIRRDATGRQIVGPGLGDNSLGVAALLGLARQLSERAIIPQSDIWWVATVGEEGLGDLCGMRHACARIGDDLGAVIVLEGLGLGRVYHAGLGVRRLKVEVRGPGGHSWLHSDRPSAIHQLIAIGAALIKQVSPGENPRTSFNIGLIEGGDTINSRASHASLSIDLRSEDPQALAAIERDVVAAITHTPCHPSLMVTTHVIGDRPYGRLHTEHPLVLAACAVLDAFEWRPVTLDIGSTDANVPLSLGIPSVCIGLTTGGNAHTLEECIETPPLPTGMRQLTLLALAAADHLAQWAEW